MKNLIYVSTAASLISIVPYLATFNRDHVTSHGLISLEIFILLLIFLKLRDSIKNKKILSAIFGIVLCALSWIDLLAITHQNETSVSFYGIIPFATVPLALFSLKKATSFTWSQMNLIAFSILVLHFLILSFIPATPLLDLTTIRAFTLF